MDRTESLLCELETALREFPLRHIERHALPELRVRLEKLARKLQLVKLPIRANTLAPLLKERARQLQLDDNRLCALIHTIKLKSAVLKETRDWFTYELCGAGPEPEPLADAISLTPRRVQHALRHSRKRGRIDIVVHSVQMDQWIFMSATSAGTGAALEAKQPLLVAFQPVASYVFVSRKTLSVTTATALARGLGWESAVNANLTGRHLDSLLRVLEQERNGSVHGLMSREPYVSRPQMLCDGITAGDCDYDAEYADGILGKSPPCLRRLEGHSKRLYSEDPKFEVRVSVRIESEDIASTLRDMVRVEAIAPNSPWLHLFRSTTSNVVDLDVAVDTTATTDDDYE